MKIDYRSFIQDNFFIKNKEGIYVPFIFNDVQNWYYDILQDEYGEEMQGIRENDLKGRQFGISSLIEGIFATDFIMSELSYIPIIDSDVYSYTDKDTKAHTDRFNLFLESYLMNDQGASVEDMETSEGREARQAFRDTFLSVDNGNFIQGKRGALYHSQTASAKVSGRGGTKQNIHWTEPAFYPNTQIMSAETLVTGAEEQVPNGYGKIFRESTGNLAGDYFAIEYQKGKDGTSDFKSRFLVWYLHKPYSTEAPDGWVPPAYYTKLVEDELATVDQCYWHFNKTRGLTDKKRLREYPTYDTEAFLYGGSPFFDADALLYYTQKIMKPMKESLYVQSLS